MAIHQTYQGPAFNLIKPKVVIVVAIGKNRELGFQDKLLWHIPDDLKRFRAQTKGNPIIMGRKTFESIVGYIGKPLPERTNIVVTRDKDWKHEGGAAETVKIFHSFDAALDFAKTLHRTEIHIGGGAQIYEQALPYVDELRLTLIDDEKQADTFFPPYEADFTKITFEESHEFEGLRYRWVNLER